MAAKFEFEVMVSPSSARLLFQRALHLLPQEKKLWLEVKCIEQSISLSIDFRLKVFQI